MSPDALRAFRREVRDWCRANLAPDLRAKVIANRHLDKADHVGWQKQLAERGWFVGHWPKALGGCAWTPLQRWVFENELYYEGAPWLMPFGISYVAPVLYTFGTPAQCARHLPAIRDSEIWWAQGYSEPNAGSDLAAVGTRAEWDGAAWIVTGTKMWTTYAQYADWLFAIVRTEAGRRPQEGLSFMLIDLRAEGVTIAPVRTIDGAHHVNQIFLDRVRVPAENIVGTPGQGWAYAKFLLGNERLLTAEVGRCARAMNGLRRLLRELPTAGRPLAEDVSWRRRVSGLEARLIGLESLALEMLRAQSGGADPGARASVLKLVGSPLAQDIESATLDLLGHEGPYFENAALAPGWAGEPAGHALAAGAVRAYLYGRAATIYGGSSEIQRNIVAKAVLGL